MTIRWPRFLAIPAIVASLVFLGSEPSRAEVIRMAGTGSAHGLLSQLGAAYAAVHPGLRIEVIPDLGSSGALRALADGVIDLAVSGHPLKPEQSAKGLREIAILRTPIVFVTSRSEPTDLQSTDVVAAFGNPDAKWPDGVPIRIVLRLENDMDNKLLQEFFPGMADSLRAARIRPEVPVAATDFENTRVAEEMPGSLTATTLVQLNTEKRRLHAVTIDGIEPSLENLANGRYRPERTLRFVVSAKSRPAARGFAAFLASEPALRMMHQAGILPAPRPAGL